MEKKIKQPLKVYVVGSSTGYANWVTNVLVDTIEEADLVLLTGGEDVNPKYYGERPHYTTSFSDRDIREFEIIHQAIALKKPLYGTCRGLQILTVAAGGDLIQHQSNNYSNHLVADLLYDLDPSCKELKNYKISGINLIPVALNYGKSTHKGTNNHPLRYSTMKSSVTLKSEEEISNFLFNVIKNNKIPITTTSAHHQAAYPYNKLQPDEYKILTWTTGMHKMHLNGKGEELEIPEEREIEAMFLPKIKAFGVQGHPEWMVSELTHSTSAFDSLMKVIGSKELENPVDSIEYLESIVNSDEFLHASSLFKTYLYYLASISHITGNTCNVGSKVITDSLSLYLTNLTKLYFLNIILRDQGLSTQETVKFSQYFLANFKDLNYLDYSTELIELVQNLLGLNNEVEAKKDVFGKGLVDSLYGKSTFSTRVVDDYLSLTNAVFTEATPSSVTHPEILQAEFDVNPIPGEIALPAFDFFDEDDEEEEEI